ncbi:NUDIX hydrolase [Xylocopilactobacillus apis]|uniref:Phosphohydrolase n=1 Tax=Xylocopilactobacillus apis TaxID=2932183 RepID=A0AAU9D7H5_9LACO|nr:NUDIX hydrolase [Xylocopilactobacillus apis]BDR57385.1 phosphohydrolase [Xylocopilactobacillus apis]
MTIDYLAKYRRMLALAESGLAYAKDPFDIERYEEIKKIVELLMSANTEVPLATIEKYVALDQGYATPKAEVRAFIRRGQEVLLVQDHATQLWSLPGGFADIGYSPSENAAKEVFEETGLKVKVDGLIALYDTEKRPDIPQIYQFYKMIFACTPESGSFKENNETDQVKYFTLDNLPPLSLNRTTSEQLKYLFNVKIKPLVID